MIRHVSFTIEGPPRGKGRPRFAKIGNFFRTYTDKETMSYENVVRFSYLGAKERPDNPITCPIHMDTKFYFQPPQSLSNKKRAALLAGNGAPFDKKPDLDNLLKSVMDGLNGVAYNDDRIVCSHQTIKRYSERPRTEVMLVWNDAQE